MLNTYILQIYQPLNFLGTMWRWVRQAMVDVEQIFGLLDIDQSIPEPMYPEALAPSVGSIEFRNVSFKYNDEQEGYIIDNISFTVPAGKSFALVGATGAGKSTIMRLLYRFYDINEGQILIDGQNITSLKISDLRSKIAIVPQDCVLFNDTLKYNIAYGGVSNKSFKKLLEEESYESEKKLMYNIVKVSKKAQIHEFVKKKTHQYYENVGERGLKLSGGEK